MGPERVPAKDPRLQMGERRVTLSPRNANTMRILHFLYHLKSMGTAGFVMATGELSNGEAIPFSPARSEPTGAAIPRRPRHGCRRRWAGQTRSCRGAAVTISPLRRGLGLRNL